MAIAVSIPGGHDDRLSSESLPSRPYAQPRMRELARVLGFQVVDVTAIGLREGSALEEQNVLRVELGAARKIVGAGDDGVVDDEHFIVHTKMAIATRAIFQRFEF